MMMSRAGAVIPENVKVTLLPDKKVAVEANIPQSESANFEIVNLGTRETLYDDRLGVAGTSKVVYDLQALPEGKYSLIIEHGKMTYEKEILIADEKTYLVKETSYVAPKFETSEEGNLNVTYFNRTGEPVEVSFFEGSNQLFSDVIGIPGSFKKSYNLKNLDNGNYNVILKTGSKSFYYDLKKK